MKDKIQKAVSQALRQLEREDGNLFALPIEEHADYNARKLHEVCINHKLANHLERQFEPLWDRGDKMFVDIEFNRCGIDYKTVVFDAELRVVRPDIIVHNRKSGLAAFNLLIVECKKDDAFEEDIEEDQNKVRALMQDTKYNYPFGLQVIYSAKGVRGELFFKDGDEIRTEQVAACQ